MKYAMRCFKNVPGLLDQVNGWLQRASISEGYNKNKYRKKESIMELVKKKPSKNIQIALSSGWKNGKDVYTETLEAQGWLL